MLLAVHLAYWAAAAATASCLQGQARKESSSLVPLDCCIFCLVWQSKSHPAVTEWSEIVLSMTKYLDRGPPDQLEKVASECLPYLFELPIAFTVQQTQLCIMVLQQRSSLCDCD